MERDNLWQRLKAFEVGEPGATLGFVDRLARENGWTKEFAASVFLEYKKFLYLIATTGLELTPSDAVDQAWHLHLVYTRSYWQDLCGDILGFSLHHQPTRGGAPQRSHFEQTYQQTLDSYRQCFGPSPESVWPGVEARFRDAAAFQRVNTARSWIIRKSAFSPRAVMLNLSVPLLLTACAPKEGESPFWFWVKVAFGVWGVYIVIRVISNALGGTRGGGSGGDGGGGAGCSGCGGCCGGGGD